MRKIQKFGLSVFVLFSASCTNFDWKPRPYVGDSPNQQIINEKGETVRCDQPVFDTYTCFDADNIAELKSAIDQIKDKKSRSKALNIFRELRIK